MKNKGFTLIELLAVIVILAIIALIATPIILGIINDAKIESEKRSVELYAKAVENAVASYNFVQTPEVGMYQSQDNGKTLVKGSTVLNVQYEGSNVECDVLIKGDGSIYISNCKVEGTLVNYSKGDKPLCLSVTNENKTLGNVPSGNLNNGDEYICDVDGSNSLHFFILSKEDSLVNLILDHNIGNNVSWNEGGPATVSSPGAAIGELDSNVSSWVENKLLTNYSSIGISFEGSFVERLYTINYKNKKARLPHYQEIYNINNSESGLPLWLTPEGYYWTDDAYTDVLTLDISKGYAYGIGDGYLRWFGSDSELGVRPVIAVSKSNLG